jgi:hypothetical protein
MNDETVVTPDNETPVEILDEPGNPILANSPEAPPDLIPDEKVAAFVNQVVAGMFNGLGKKLKRMKGKADIRSMMIYMGGAMRAYTDAVERDITAAVDSKEKLDLYKFFLSAYVRDTDE